MKWMEYLANMLAFFCALHQQQQQQLSLLSQASWGRLEMKPT
jgi:hypothetical protein